MSKYNAGDKFIIEIGEIFTGDCSIRNRLEERYAIKGFNALMFDNNGLDRLQRYDGNTCLDGVQAGLESLDCSVRNAYEKGLSDAWELARKISLHVTDGGVDMSPSELRTVFDIEPMVDPTYCILRDYKAEEVINRLKSYEDNKIEVGDFVYNDDTMEEGVVTHVGDGEIFMLYSDGSCGRAEGRLTKTGKKCDVGEFLAKIGKE